MPSFMHELVVWVIQATGWQRPLLSPAAFTRHTARLRRKPADTPPWIVRMVCDIKPMPNAACRSYELRSVFARGAPARATLLYLHGGCHTWPATRYHVRSTG